MFTIAEVAGLWSVSRDTVERMLTRRELRFVSLPSGRRRIPASALEEFQAEHEELAE